MTVQRAVIDGAPCSVAEWRDGYVKILFDDGRMVIARPAPPRAAVQDTAAQGERSAVGYDGRGREGA